MTAILHADFKLQIAPIPYISIIGEFNRNDFNKVGNPVTTKTVDLYIVQSRFALNPRVQLSALFQKNSLNDSKTYNIRFSWEFSPLSYIYLIYNHGAVYDNLTLQNATDDHLIGKISLLKQF